MRLRFRWIVPASVLLVACGGKAVVERGDPGAGGAGGATSSSTSSATSVTTGTTGEGGGTQVFCGGFGGIACEGGFFCDWADDSCGGDDSGGVCVAGPQGCPADCPGVCGCDGQFYCNACTAHAYGVDVSAGANCGVDDGAEG